MVRHSRYGMITVAAIGTIVAAVTLHVMHLPWVGGTATYAGLMSAVVMLLRPQDIGWPPPVKISVTELIASGGHKASGALPLGAAEMMMSAMVRDLKAVDVASRDIAGISAVVQSHVVLAVAAATRTVASMARAIDEHIGVCHIALVARAVPAPRFCRAQPAAA